MDQDKSVEVILGQYQSLTSPVPFSRRATLLNVDLKSTKKFQFQSEDQEIAIYMVSGSGQLNGESTSQHQVVIFEASREIQLTALEDCHFVVMGGTAYHDKSKYSGILFQALKKKLNGHKKIGTQAISPWCQGKRGRSNHQFIGCNQFATA